MRARGPSSTEQVRAHSQKGALEPSADADDEEALPYVHCIAFAPRGRLLAVGGASNNSYDERAEAYDKVKGVVQLLQLTADESPTASRVPERRVAGIEPATFAASTAWLLLCRWRPGR